MSPTLRPNVAAHSRRSGLGWYLRGSLLGFAALAAIAFVTLWRPRPMFGVQGPGSLPFLTNWVPYAFARDNFDNFVFFDTELNLVVLVIDTDSASESGFFPKISARHAEFLPQSPRAMLVDRCSNRMFVLRSDGKRFETAIPSGMASAWFSNRDFCYPWAWTPPGTLLDSVEKHYRGLDRGALERFLDESRRLRVAPAATD